MENNEIYNSKNTNIGIGNKRRRENVSDNSNEYTVHVVY